MTTTELQDPIDFERELNGEAPPAMAPTFHYDTETVEMARTIVNQIGRLSRLVSEDDTEIAHLEKTRDRAMHDLQMRFEAEQNAIISEAGQAVAIVNARRADRVNARAAAQKVVDELQVKK